MITLGATSKMSTLAGTFHVFKQYRCGSEEAQALS